MKKKRNNFQIVKSAFTFAELMVSLVVISIITALLYPTIAELTPNNNKHLYRSAYKTVETVVQDIIKAGADNSETFAGVPECTPDPDDASICTNQAAIDTAKRNGNELLCTEFKNRLNTISWTGATAGAGVVPASYTGCEHGNARQELRTSNGMRWWFQDVDQCPAPNSNRTCFTIYVDVNASNNGSNFTSVSCDGSITGDPSGNFGSDPAWTTGCFRQRNDLGNPNDRSGDIGRDTFKIEIRSDGKINPGVDEIGIRHLQELSE